MTINERNSHSVYCQINTFNIRVTLKREIAKPINYFYCLFFRKISWEILKIPFKCRCYKEELKRSIVGLRLPDWIHGMRITGHDLQTGNVSMLRAILPTNNIPNVEKATGRIFILILHRKCSFSAFWDNISNTENTNLFFSGQSWWICFQKEVWQRNIFHQLFFLKKGNVYW